MPTTGSVFINFGVVGGSMRKIAFRVWDKEEKVMLYPEDDVIDICFSKRGIDVINTSISEWLREGTFELLEFTGLKDKNGKMIFEGDIIDFAGLKPIEIVWSKVGFKSKMFGSEPIKLDQEGMTAFGEIIGNIYQNKDLLNSGR